MSTPITACPRADSARDTLRLEAGLPLHGHELGPGITPLQAGLGWVVRFDKGDFRDRLCRMVLVRGGDIDHVDVGVGAEQGAALATGLVADDSRADLIFEKKDLLAPMLPGMLAPPHPMVPGTTDTDYYQGKVTGSVPEQAVGGAAAGADTPDLEDAS